MTDDQKYEIACLADDLHTKRVAYEALRMMNTPPDPDERRKAAVELAIAAAEVWEAQSKLGAAMSRIAYT